MAWQAFNGRTLDLERWPPGAQGNLQAWDAADEYIVNRLRDDPPPPGVRVLLVDDAWGALATALAPWRPVVWGDSRLGQLALAENLRCNGLEADAARFVPADDVPDGRFALACVRLPKALDRLDDLLRRLRPALESGAMVIAGGMTKHTPTRAWRLLEQLIGPTVTTPGWKKARLGFTRPADHPLPPAITPAPCEIPASALTLHSRAGVFSAGKLDGGTALLLRHLPTDGASLAAADLGCGNGVLALALARRCPLARITGVDESYLAVASARDNLARNFTAAADAARVRFVVNDGLEGFETGSLDLVVCNPPFHQGQSVADVAATRLFRQAHGALRPGGRLLVVGNRHLGHHAKLEGIFGHHELVDGDRRFTVVATTRR